MTRAEIGSFIGLQLETVSRVLSRFAQDGLLEVKQKYVRIVDPDGLRAIVSGEAPDREMRQRLTEGLSVADEQSRESRVPNLRSQILKAGAC
jgi:DNA-binding transcriptional regulator YhcF (GntR family)